MKAEVPGPVFGKVVSKTKNTAPNPLYPILLKFILFVVIFIILPGCHSTIVFVIAMELLGLVACQFAEADGIAPLS